MALVQFPPPDPRAPDAYGLLNPRPFQWVQPFVSAVLRYAFYRVWKELGPAVQPPQIADCSMQDGSTPREDDGELRHPGGAHDGGINVDVTYAMTEPAGDTWSVGPDDGAELTGPPSRMDLARQARWYEVIGELDLEFGGNLIRLAAVDPLAEAPVDAAISADLAESADDRNQAQAITFSSRSGGWGPTHNTHSHCRFVARDDGDRIAGEIEAKIEALLSQGPGAASPGGENEGPGSGTAPAPGDSVPATPATPAPRIPEGAKRVDPERWLDAVENGAKILIPDAPKIRPALLKGYSDLWIGAENPRNTVIQGGVKDDRGPAVGLFLLQTQRVTVDGLVMTQAGTGTRAHQTTDTTYLDCLAHHTDVEGFFGGFNTRIVRRGCEAHHCGLKPYEGEYGKGHGGYESEGSTDVTWDDFYAWLTGGSAIQNNGKPSESGKYLTNVTITNCRGINTALGGGGGWDLMGVRGLRAKNNLLAWDAVLPAGCPSGWDLGNAGGITLFRDDGYDSTDDEISQTTVFGARRFGIQVTDGSELTLSRSFVVCITDGEVADPSTPRSQRRMADAYDLDRVTRTDSLMFDAVDYASAKGLLAASGEWVCAKNPALGWQGHGAPAPPPPKHLVCPTCRRDWDGQGAVAA